MKKLKVADIREYVFPLFIQSTIEKSRSFLGTAFFITQNGIALTASHCFPPLNKLKEGENLVAGLRDDSTMNNREVRLVAVEAVTVLEQPDLAMIKVKACPVKFLPMSFRELAMGDDVMTAGIPEHSVSGDGKEFRCLKGHVTFVATPHEYGGLLQLNFAVPGGG